MADRGPNPDLSMVTGGPRQPLKVFFYVFPKSCAFDRASEATPRQLCRSVVGKLRLGSRMWLADMF